MIPLLLAVALSQAPATNPVANPEAKAEANPDAKPELAPLVTPPASTPPAVAPVAAQPVAIVSASNRALLSPELSAAIDAQVRAAIAASGIKLQSEDDTKATLMGRDPRACESNQTCLGLLAQTLFTPVLVRVEGSLVGQDVAVLLQGIAASDGTVVAEHSFVVPQPALSAGLKDQIAPFNAKLAEALKTEPPVKMPDTPKQVVLQPPPPVEHPIVQAPVEQRPSRLPAVATGIATIAAAAVAIVFTANAVSDQNCLNGPPVSGHPSVCVAQGEASALQSRANSGFTIGASAGGLAVVLGAATAYLWTHPQN